MNGWQHSRSSKDDPKTVLLHVHGVLMGKHSGNNLIIMGAYGEVKEALEGGLD